MLLLEQIVQDRTWWQGDDAAVRIELIKRGLVQAVERRKELVLEVSFCRGRWREP